MATINYYLDKEDKNGCSRIYLRIQSKGDQIKVSTGAKVPVKDFDKNSQRVYESFRKHEETNYYLDYLEKRAEELINNETDKVASKAVIKSELKKHITAYKDLNNFHFTKEQLDIYGKSYTFIDLFAGAGGFSEGFLQAQLNDRFFNFLLASDINENCELTHLVRYNHQLGLNADFLTQDITEPDYLDNLLKKIGDKKVDVVCGGPPCQSFSLAGKRKKFDKKDDLFSHYLKVIKALQPKYFVMENVKGILTKENGEIKELILNEINSIINYDEVDKLTSFIKKLESKENQFLLDSLIRRINIEQYADDNDRETESKENYIKSVEAKFRKLTPKIVDYKTSKTDDRVNTIRHGLNLLRRNKEVEKLRRDVIKEKDHSYIDGDYFVDTFDNFLSGLDTSLIIGQIRLAFEQLNVPKRYEEEYKSIFESLKIYVGTFDDAISFLMSFCDEKQRLELEQILQEIRLYKIESPLVLNASDYGVPQNRERVVFIGCRNDQKLIKKIPPTIKENEKVTTLEALYDLDFLGNNDERGYYSNEINKKKYNGELIPRSIDGKPNKENGYTYAEWSSRGRLNGRFKHNPPFYVSSKEDLENNKKKPDILHNHKTSNQSKKVINRLDVILKHGDYSDAQKELDEKGLASKKRNYNVLDPKSQSPTIMTIPDDYIHYSTPRALTVREMARLQSFDDSFVFQGKRSTGGNNRKHEIPQYTLVGNAVPPLLARAIGMEILKVIK
ncbi:MAG: DNA cytosine methyltransferase [Candidatus Paceibacterota bacterium]